MKILRQPTIWYMSQPLLNKMLRVYASVSQHASRRGSYVDSSETVEYYDSKTRARLPRSNWRVQIIRKIGT